MTTPLRLMPERLNLGSQHSTTMSAPIHTRREPQYDLTGRRSVMGFPLPAWQRPFVWTPSQCVRFIESAWLGLNLGSYSYNQVEPGSPLDGLLIDGQQRMTALEMYLDDKYPVFGYLWSETTIVDKRKFEMTTAFASYVTTSNDEDWLRRYYDMMNFGGTAHTEDQRAVRPIG